MLKHTYDIPTTPRRAIVIGGAGFVGGAVVQELRRYRVPVLAVSRADVDLTADDAVGRLAALLTPGDTVIAVAAKAPCKSLEMLIDNMKVVRSMLEAMKQAEIAHLVNISSDAVYGDGPIPLTENSPVAPGSFHGVMHLARELAFTTAAIAPLAILRPTLIYGAGDPHNGYGPNRFLRQASEGQPIALFGEGEERRDHVSIDDVAKIVTGVVLRRSVGTLNIASGEVHSFADAARWAIQSVRSASGLKPSVRVGPMPHNGYRPFDITALKAAFPDIAPLQLPDGIKALAKERVKN